VRGYAVLAVVSFVALRGSMAILVFLVFVVLSSVNRSSLDLAFEWFWIVLGVQQDLSRQRLIFQYSYHSLISDCIA
ncbi:hypothetical protein A2U01_0084991, partial [Trifolium medium]|nr:hypothetical protein [Trifolium medium]